jgi:formylglycine-generating enzyme required for sulfatase activity
MTLNKANKSNNPKAASNRKYIVLAAVVLVLAVAFVLWIFRGRISVSRGEATIRLDGGVTIRLKQISAGKFLMGGSDQEVETARREAANLGMMEYDPSDELPRHEVAISKVFYIGVYPITQGQWKSVMNTQPWKGEYFVKEGDEYPATYVNWDDANEFCKQLSKKIGATVRLPTEAEREYACRAGTQSRFYYGDDPDNSKLGDYAWYEGNTTPAGQKYPHPVGQKTPNAWGLFDMHGNVWEWCSDRYEKEFYGVSGSVDPTGSQWGPCHVIRGGAWARPVRSCRSANRGWSDANHKRGVIGFRIVMELK